MASKLHVEEVLQQINDEEWCDSDDDCLDDDQDGNLDDFSQLEDPLDKAGAGNEDDDEDDETLDTTASLPSQESVSILACNTPPDLPASSSTPQPIHVPNASTIGQVPIYSASQHLFTPVPGPKATMTTSVRSGGVIHSNSLQSKRICMPHRREHHPGRM